MKFYTIPVTCIICLCLTLPKSASAQLPSADTLLNSVKKDISHFSWGLTGALHSESLYFYTGVVDQSHPSFDLLYSYDKNGWGGILYKAIDLEDHQTGINYAMMIFRKRIYASDRLVIIPNIGLNLNQNYSFADKGSDLMGGVAAAYKLNARFALSGDAIFQNMGVSKEYNWTNRIKLAYDLKNFSTSLLIWDRNRVFHNSGYLSAGFDLRYAVIRTTAGSPLTVGASYIRVLQSDTPRNSGFQFNLGFDLGN